MINCSVRNKAVANSVSIGAIACHTPKSIAISKDNVTLYTGQTCRLIDNLDDLDKYFGDPYVDPTTYSDLIIAKEIIQKGVPLYISSVDDIRYNVDSFQKILYNGYTEFYFKEGDFDTVGYRLKSDIKFCQPIISSIEFSNEYNQLHLYVQLYHLDRGMTKKFYTLNKPDASFLYKTVHFVFDNNTVTDDLIIEDFDSNGLELQIVFSGGDEKALVNQFNRFRDTGLKVLLTSLEGNNSDYTVHSKYYHYDIHSSDYIYDLTDDEENNKADASYIKSVNALSSMIIEPTLLCIGRMFHSVNYYDEDFDNVLLSSKLLPLDPESQLGVYTILLGLFPEECNTYVLINMPDLSVSSAVDLLNQQGKFSSNTSGNVDVIRLPEQYNCDLFFGYATDIINTSFVVESPRKVFYSAAVLSFYSLLISNDAYLTNNFIGLNISNNCIKLILSESSAESLKKSRCNSMVLFDTGSPSVYGDRTLSNSANLKYSHISRNFIAIRRIIHNYLETRKFILNTEFNIDACICYIKFNILDEFRSQGVLTEYKVNYYSEGQTVFINIVLLFPSIAESISLDFTI